MGEQELRKLSVSIAKRLEEYHSNLYGDLNKYGNEKIGHIKVEKMVEYPTIGILMLFKAIHYDEKHPYNINIFINKNDDNMVNIFNGEEWKKECFDDILNPLVCRLFDILKKSGRDSPKIGILGRRIENRDMNLMRFLADEIKNVMRNEKRRLQELKN